MFFGLLRRDLTWTGLGSRNTYVGKVSTSNAKRLEYQRQAELGWHCGDQFTLRCVFSLALTRCLPVTLFSKANDLGLGRPVHEGDDRTSAKQTVRIAGGFTRLKTDLGTGIWEAQIDLSLNMVSWPGAGSSF